jgi:hypothetical protein
MHSRLLVALMYEAKLQGHWASTNHFQSGAQPISMEFGLRQCSENLSSESL